MSERVRVQEIASTHRLKSPILKAEVIFDKNYVSLEPKCP